MEEGKNDQAPLISVGVPVRNGGPMLEQALRSVVEQSYPNLEVLISDNGSTDETPAVCQRFAVRDQRIRYFRQEKVFSSLENFEFVLRKSRGEYFMWVAHDDLRSDDFIEKLHNALRDNPHAVLAFGDLFVGTTEEEWRRREFDFENQGLTALQRLKKTANRQCYHIYGLWRAQSLKKCRFSRTYFWYDLPVMMAASALGTFVRASGTSFYYHEVPKSNTERMQIEFNTKRKHLLILRVTLATFSGMIAVGHRLSAVPAAWYVFCARFGSWLNIEVRGFFYRLAPQFVRDVWRKIKGHFA